MPTIKIKHIINADIQLVFDLARSIDLHEISTKRTNEKAIGGVTSGLIEKNETVTWRAKHFGIYQKLTVKITEMKSPNYFSDEMQKGAFKRFKHEHFFEEQNGVVVMNDVFDYTSPLGFLGKIADKLFLKKYMTRFLIERNNIIKEFAESEKWKEVLEK